MRFISKEELGTLLQGQTSAYLLDVRTEPEYEAGHIHGALYVPWESVSEKLNGMKKETSFILYCRTGVRAMKAARLLEQNGFTSVAVYPGGWEEWNS